MNLLGCLDAPTAGRYLLDGEDVGTLSADRKADLRNRTLGFVFQNYSLLPRTTALDNVALPLLYAGVRRKDVRPRARAALERVGLGDRLLHHPNQMSGGQQQRVAIARAIVTRPAAMPTTPPTSDSTTASIKNCWRMWRGRAPTAMRRPISRVRSVTLTSMMFMMPMPPTSRLTSAMPASRRVIVSVPSWRALAISARLLTVKSSSAPARRR